MRNNPNLTYGISPIFASQVYMGSVPDMPLSYVWDKSPKDFTDLSWYFSSKKSHARFWEAYGTGPIHVSHASMGPVPCFAIRLLWDQSHKVYGTSKKRNSQNFNDNFESSCPIYGSEGPMGLVPYMHIRYVCLSGTYMGLQEQLSIVKSHVCLLEAYGTSPMHGSHISMGLDPCQVL